MADSPAYPSDADGDALRRVAHDGSDMCKPMTIDFQIASPSEETARQIAAAAAHLGYQLRVYGEEDDWTCECSTRMLATYDGIIAVQKELGDLSRPFGGCIDGWGTFGNGPG